MTRTVKRSENEMTHQPMALCRPILVGVGFFVGVGFILALGAVTLNNLEYAVDSARADLLAMTTGATLSRRSVCLRGPIHPHRTCELPDGPVIVGFRAGGERGTVRVPVH